MSLNSKEIIAMSRFHLSYEDNEIESYSRGSHCDVEEAKSSARSTSWRIQF
jgi:hypothetical protein